MKPITAYVFYHFREKMELPMTKDALAIEIMKQLPEEWTLSTFPNVFAGPAKPKTVHIARELHRLGYSPKTIQEWMGLSQSTISIHLTKKNVLEYFNHNFGEYNFETQKGLQAVYKKHSNYGNNKQ